MLPKKAELMDELAIEPLKQFVAFSTLIQTSKPS